MRRDHVAITISLMVLLVLLTFPNVKSQAGFVGVPNGWGITVTYCRDGYTANVSRSTGIAAGETYSANVVSVTPAGATGLIASGSGPISGPFSSETTFFAWNTLQAPGTPTHIDVSRFWSGDSPPPQTGSENSTVGNCFAGGGAKFFNPHDGRVAPLPGDRIAVWCNYATPPTIDVWGVGPDSKGFRLFQFNVSDVAQSGSRGLFENLGGFGTVSAYMFGSDTFYVAWSGGPYNATGQGDWAKSFQCAFAGITANAVAAGSPGTIPNGTTYVVQPGDTLLSIARRANISLSQLAVANNITDFNHVKIGQLVNVP